MEQVASHLNQETLKRVGAPERDLFGRSAFNRYYYAAFLETRANLRLMSDDWASLPHKDIPAVLTGQVRDRLRHGMKQASKAGDLPTVRQCSDAMDAAEELAKTLIEAYATRVVADYNAEILINFKGTQEYSLNEVSVEKAKAWPHRARTLARMVSSAWQQINV